MSSDTSSTKRHHHRGRTREQEWKQPEENNNNDRTNSQENPSDSSLPSKKRHHHRHHRKRSQDQQQEANPQEGTHEDSDKSDHPESSPASSQSPRKRHHHHRRTRTQSQQPENNELTSRLSRSLKSRHEKEDDEPTSSEEKQKGGIGKREILRGLALGKKLYESSKDEGDDGEKKEGGWKYHGSIAASTDQPTKQLKASLTMEKNVRLKGMEYLALRLLKLKDQNPRKHEIAGIGTIGVQVQDGNTHAVTGMKVARKKGREAKVVISVDMHLPFEL